MPRPIKYDDTIFPKPIYWGKILMYNNFNILYPLVDIIRILPKVTIIAHKFGKNQENIRLYATQYSHNAVMIELKKRHDYIEELKCVKFIFIFSDTFDSIADNLIKYSEKSKTNLICYSSLDSIYYFYEYQDQEKIIHKFKEPGQVIEKMEYIKEKGIVNKLQELFPDFEIIEQPEIKTDSKLSMALKFLKEENQQKPKSYKIPFNQNFNKLQYMESGKKKITYDDELPVKPAPSSKSILSSFFKKL